MGLKIQNVEVPYEVEVGGPEAIQAFVAAPEKWYAEKERRLISERKSELKSILEGMTAEELGEYAVEIGMEKQLKGTKPELVSAITKHVLKEEGE